MKWDQRGDLHLASISVLPEHDYVPLVDTHVGLIQKIDCSEKTKALQFACHKMETTICELINRCGDPRRRFTACQNFDFEQEHDR